MRRIGFNEAKSLINSDAAGYYEAGGCNIRPHPAQTCIHIGGLWYLAQNSEFRVLDHGIIGGPDVWGRVLVPEICDEELARMLVADARARGVTLAELS